MAAVYKSLSKPDRKDEDKGAGSKKNKQRVLILSSRGVTYRYAENMSPVFLFYYCKMLQLRVFQRQS